jgi:hypothetical protein
MDLYNHSLISLHGVVFNYFSSGLIYDHDDRKTLFPSVSLWGIFRIWRTWSSTKTNSVFFSPQPNYTDWSTVAGSPILVPTFVDRGMSRGQSSGTLKAVNVSFLDRSRYYSFQIAPHFAPWVWVDPFQIHCYSGNLAALGIEPGTSGTAARNSDNLTTEAVTWSSIRMNSLKDCSVKYLRFETHSIVT